MFPILLNIGPITLHTYGLLVAIGFLAGLYVARKQFVQFGLPESKLDGIVFSLMVFGLLGARALYFAVDNFIALQADPLSFFRIWEGGLVFYGGVIAGLLVLWFYSVRYRWPFLALTDAFAAPLLIGHALGRLGCFSAGCCYGKPTEWPWGVVFEHPATLAPRFVSLHPTQLYEAVGNLALFWTALLLSRRVQKNGFVTAFYAISYGTFRFLVEFLRGDDRGIYRFGVSPSQLIAIFLVLVGFGVLRYAKKTESR